MKNLPTYLPETKDDCRVIESVIVGAVREPPGQSVRVIRIRVSDMMYRDSKYTDEEMP